MAFLAIESENQQLSDLLELVCEQLQLTDTQHTDAETSYHGIGKWLSADDGPLAIFNPEIFPQGSKALLTTVKPRKREEFDIDLVCVLDRNRHLVSPVTVFNDVADRIRSHDTYRSMMTTDARCIVLTYERQYRLEIVPAVPSVEDGRTALVIPDREQREWVKTDPKGYVRWFAAQAMPLSERRALAASVEPLPPNVSSGEKTVLQRTVQLFKRRRDIHFDGAEEATRSIVLTTINAEVYGREENLLDAITNNLDRISRMADGQQAIPRVPCPTNPLENLAQDWQTNPRTYLKFRMFIGEFKEKMERLKSERSMPRIADLLEDMFDPSGSGVVNNAVRAYTDRYASARASGGIRMTRATSALTTAAPAAASFAIPRNSFYGD